MQKVFSWYNILLNGFDMKKMSKLVVSVSIVFLLGMTIIPLSVQAGPTDSYFILGQWKHEATDGPETTVTKLTFKLGGEGEMEVEYTGESSSSTSNREFTWEFVDDKLEITYADWDTTISYTYELSDLYTTLDLDSGWGGETQYKKTASICGVCCPFPFMVIGVPAFACLGGMILLKKRK